MKRKPTGYETGKKRRLVEYLRKIQHRLPVFIVIRLATDDEDAIAYYNEIESEVELNVDVLDDIASEAKEIRAAGNGWLTYTPLLHRVREAGTFLKLLDVLDERKLTPAETALATLRLFLRR